MRRLSLLVAALLIAATASAQTTADIVVERALSAPRIDGVLDDEVWVKAVLLPTDGWTSYQPVRGDRSSTSTSW